MLADSTRARQAFNDAQSALERLKTDKTEAEGDIKDIFEVEGFGREGEWKKLDGQCVQTDSGEYVPFNQFVARSRLGLIFPFHVTQLYLRTMFLRRGEADTKAWRIDLQSWVRIHVLHTLIKTLLIYCCV